MSTQLRPLLHCSHPIKLSHPGVSNANSRPASLCLPSATTYTALWTFPNQALPSHPLLCLSTPQSVSSQPVEGARHGVNWITQGYPRKRRLIVLLFSCKITYYMTFLCLFYFILWKSSPPAKTLTKPQCAAQHTPLNAFILGILSQRDWNTEGHWQAFTSF